MKKSTKTIILFILILLCLSVRAQQLTGIVVDAESGEGIPMASVIYKGHNVAKVADVEGRFIISKHTGWNLTFSAVGYKCIMERNSPNTFFSLRVFAAISIPTRKQLRPFCET